MIFLKLAVFYVVCRWVSIGFCEDESKKRDVLEKRAIENKELVKEAYLLMKKEKSVIINTVRELREENSKLRWKLQGRRRL